MAKQNYTRFIWLFMEARVQNGVSGGYMHNIFEPGMHQGPEIWTILLHSFAKGQLPG